MNGLVHVMSAEGLLLVHVPKSATSAPITPGQSIAGLISTSCIQRFFSENCFDFKAAIFASLRRKSKAQFAWETLQNFGAVLPLLMPRDRCQRAK